MMKLCNECPVLAKCLGHNALVVGVSKDKHTAIKTIIVFIAVNIIIMLPGNDEFEFALARKHTSREKAQ